MLIVIADDTLDFAALKVKVYESSARKGHAKKGKKKPCPPRETFHSLSVVIKLGEHSCV